MLCFNVNLQDWTDRGAFLFNEASQAVQEALEAAILVAQEGQHEEEETQEQEEAGGSDCSIAFCVQVSGC